MHVENKNANLPLGAKQWIDSSSNSELITIGWWWLSLQYYTTSLGKFYGMKFIGLSIYFRWNTPSSTDDEWLNNNDDFSPGRPSD